MPELPEVQTVVNELADTVIGKTITSCEVLRTSLVQGRSDDFKKELRDRCINAVSRKGKFIIFALCGNLWLIAHLRMTGKFVVQRKNKKKHQHDRVVFHLDDGFKLVFNDVRCFGRLELVRDLDIHCGLAKLGLDPWDKNLTPEKFLKEVGTRRTTIKTALLDQGIIAGLGNIYASEILFDADIHPSSKANAITEKQAVSLLKSMRKILELALRYNGTSISDYRRIDEKQGMFQNFLRVYSKEGQKCPKCSTVILKIRQNQRSTFLCPVCQKYPAS